MPSTAPFRSYLPGCGNRHDGLKQAAAAVHLPALGSLRLRAGPSRQASRQIDRAPGSAQVRPGGGPVPAEIVHRRRHDRFAVRCAGHHRAQYGQRLEWGPCRSVAGTSSAAAGEVRSGTSQSPVRPALGNSLLMPRFAALRGHGSGTARLVRGTSWRAASVSGDGGHGRVSTCRAAILSLPSEPC
jgi:hypothetical protein